MSNPSYAPFLSMTWFVPPAVASWMVLLGWILLAAITAALLFVAAAVGLVLICVFLLPRPVGKAIGWTAIGLFYRIQLHHPERLPATGGVVVLPNHISWLDGILLLMIVAASLDCWRDGATFHIFARHQLFQAGHVTVIIGRDVDRASVERILLLGQL